MFSIEALEQLIDTGVDIVKIPSGEITNIPLFCTICNKCNSAHISSGMSTFAEIDAALKIISAAESVLVFQCKSQYPVPPERIGLNAISKIRESYRLPIGLSDHSKGIEMSVAAIALGAVAIEKHLSFSRRMYGSAALNALEPSEFRALCTAVNNVWNAPQNPVDKNDISELLDTRATFQQGIFAKRKLPDGQKLSLNDVAFLKPILGRPVEQIDSIMVEIIGQHLFIQLGIY